jgi:hypothetical protein
METGEGRYQSCGLNIGLDEVGSAGYCECGAGKKVGRTSIQLSFGCGTILSENMSRALFTLHLNFLPR